MDNAQNSGKKDILSRLSEDRATKSNNLEVPQISLPKGGGALKGIDETFQVNAANGTASFSLSLPFSPNRNGFNPQLTLSYNSGIGNSLFGIGWSLGLPSIQRRTDKKLPRYFDTNNIENIAKEDSFMFSGVEEMVPLLDWKNNQWDIRQEATIDGYIIRQYRPRIEGGFSRIERIYHPDHGYYWRATSKENMVTFFGYSPECRIANPTDPTQIFEWLPECSFDDKGSWIWYEYKSEDLKNVSNDIQEKNRFNGIQLFANKHIKSVKYGNRKAFYPKEIYAIEKPADATHFFEMIFDYGEHDTLIPKIDDDKGWPSRKDPFSSYRSGFEIRNYRLCRRVLMYHLFPELNAGMSSLVRSLNFNYKLSDTQTAQADRPAELSYLMSITQRGYVWNGDNYSAKNLPAITFDYQWLHWNTEVKEVSAENLVNSPNGLSGNYQWVDLYNEGISGILTEQANSWYYKSNSGVDKNGEITFERAKIVGTKPSFAGIGNGTLQLQDLEANGQKQIVVNTPGTQGFFELNEEGAWQPFQSFLKTLNIDLHDPNVRMLDVNGDGRPEILFSDLGAFWWWENDGKIGYDSHELAAKPYDEEIGAAILFSDMEQRIFLADMTGDGLTDLVRIRNGEICYWANLGYGYFAAKVTMDNAPRFDLPEQFNPSYLQLTDISGTGATDIIYLGKNQFNAYLNFSGNAWSDATVITPFFPTEKPNKITVTDLLGNGTACIVWSSEMPAYSNAPMRYIDLMGGKKPHIMCSHENGMGKRTELAYKSSTSYYLEDKKNGTPWITKLAFPVQVVAQTTITDSVTNVRFSSQYSYHHGYYDHTEREFRGFGRVDQIDSEGFDVFVQTGASNTVPPEKHQPPVLTKTWYHTGAFLDKERMLNQFKNEYWYVAPKANGFSMNATEYELPDAILIAAANLTNFSIDQLHAAEWREALRACKGMTLRQEIFGLDSQKRISDEQLAKNYTEADPAFLTFKAAALETEQIPYSVATHNCEIQLLQGRCNNKYAVFTIKESETINYVYERNAEDPRIAHTLTIETDELGNILESATVVYPRLQLEPLLLPTPADTIVAQQAKNNANDAQRKQWISYTKSGFTNDILTAENYYLRKGWQTQTYELTGLKPANGSAIFSKGDFKDLLDNISEIAYQQIADPGKQQKRLVEHAKTKFYDEMLATPLNDGAMAARGIPYESYQLAYTPGLLQDVFTPSAFSAKFTVTDVDMQQGKFVKDNGNWWIQSGTVQYTRAGEDFATVESQFFAPVGYTDPFESKTEVFYDQYCLFMQRALDAHQNETKVIDFNYRSLSPVRMQDINDNISSVVVDELGLVKATAIEGKPVADPLQGEEADNLMGFTEQTQASEQNQINQFFALSNVAAPDVCDYDQLQLTAHDLLGNASARMVYDFTRQPSVVASIVREQHAKENANSALQISFEYTDGLGKVAMKKIQAEPGKIILPDGSSLDSGAQLRWIGNGRTVLNNKGNPIKQYEPYFSTTPAYENDPAWVERGISPILYYDGAGRNIKTELPNGTFTKVVFDAWKQETYDVNDTVLDSAWYAARINIVDDKNPEKIAAIKSAIHANTPSCIITDTLGRPVLGIDHNRWKDDQGNISEEKYYTWSELDIEGNAHSITDARGNKVMAWQYDMLGHRVAQTSMDAGQRWMLNDCMGKPLRSWDERQHELSFEYDALHRPTKKFVTGGDTVRYQNLCYEEIEYGDEPGMTDAVRNAEKAANRVGKPKNLFDTAGKIASGNFDFKGNLLDSTRTFTKDYKNIPDWNIADPGSLLETTTSFIFTTRTEYDALNRPVKQTTPDKKITAPVFNVAGLLDSVTLTEANGGSLFVKNIDYDEKGQRTSILYGNDVATRYSYDPLTFRLTSLKTTAKTGNVLQDLNYTYDPTGNIISINDQARPDTFFKNAIVKAENNYSYDALYRLIDATGRECDAPLNTGTADNWNDAAFMNNGANGDYNAMRLYTQYYQYDEVGNIRKMRHAAGAGSWTRNYNYQDLNNRLLSTAIGANTWLYPHQLQHGYITAMPHLQKMDWNFKEELQATTTQKVNNGIPETTYYVYDGSGQRARKITENAAAAGNTPTKKEERIYVGSYEIYTNASGLKRETLHLMDDKSRIAMLDTETAPAVTIGNKQQKAPDLRTVRYQLGNHLGSVSLELDENAQTISYEEYHPYGTTAYQANNPAIKAAAKRYRYTGMERDQETGLEYHSARYYLPWLGRWCSADPIGIGDGLNLYGYCGGQPVGKRDGSGNECEPGQEQCFTFQLTSKAPPKATPKAPPKATPKAPPKATEAPKVAEDVKSMQEISTYFNIPEKGYRAFEPIVDKDGNPLFDKEGKKVQKKGLAGLASLYLFDGMSSPRKKGQYPTSTRIGTFVEWLGSGQAPEQAQKNIASAAAAYPDMPISQVIATGYRESSALPFGVGNIVDSYHNGGADNLGAIFLSLGLPTNISSKIQPLKPHGNEHGKEVTPANVPQEYLLTIYAGIMHKNFKDLIDYIKTQQGGDVAILGLSEEARRVWIALAFEAQNGGPWSNDYVGFGAKTAVDKLIADAKKNREPLNLNAILTNFEHSTLVQMAKVNAAESYFLEIR